MTNDETTDDAADATLEEDFSRRALLLSLLGGGTLAGFGAGYLLFKDEASLSLTVDAPAAAVAGMRADGPDPVVIPGEAISLEIAYSGFYGDLFGDDLEDRPGEFDVTVAVRPAFADEFEALATGSLDAGATPGDVVTASLAAETIDSNNLDFATHGAVSDDYAEFAPDDELTETDVDLKVTVTSETYDVTASRTHTMTVTVTRLVDVVLDVDALRDSFTIDVDEGAIDAMTIGGDDCPINISYDGFDDDVAGRSDEFTVTVLARPEFADDLEVLATQSIDAAKSPADTVSGVVSTKPISLASHSEISPTFASFEPSDRIQTTELEVEIRVESTTYGVVVAELIDFSITVEKDDVTVTTSSRTRQSSSPEPAPDPGVAVGGRLVLEGEATNEPHDQL
ncbi:hypothetical protein [Natrinema limicola]|uniref:Uncharacterized protein n=1 Tax=Natrinema limicola JCM 13563 TaxID=1230457 RepID=M0BWH7_9EURY|nr:hypothetical protein [Natrinema limicola]ELZ15376.1 hypothetical protein C476_17902 [Natrinema limicola JCM 13563]